MGDSTGTQQLTGEPAARAAVIGATGFLGALSANLLWQHPRIELAAITARSERGKRLSDLYPRYRVPLELQELDLGRLRDVDVAIVAYPHGAAAPVVGELRELGLRVVDLSADFRLRDLDVYSVIYGEHGARALFGSAVYGLPELHRDTIGTAGLVAAPGCYPTAALLALAPLARAGLIARATIDAKSGVSGAGRAPTDTTHFVSVDENVIPYSVEGHRHAPEIGQELAALGTVGEFTFVPHLVPLEQGLLASCYVEPTRPVGRDDVAELFAQMYAGEPFIELATSPPGVRDVRDTNTCRIYVSVEPRTGTVMSFAAIDNLWKGGAGQAVQDLNIMLGLDEATGLRRL